VVSGRWPVVKRTEGGFLALKGTDANTPGRRRPQPWGVECRDKRQPCMGGTLRCLACVTPARRARRPNSPVK
jgi:hypothetical protein